MSPLASVRLFEGRDRMLLPMHNTDALRSGLFKVAGRMITSSILNGAPGFPCLAPSVYSYLTSGSMNEAVEMATADDIPDLEMREVLSKVSVLSVCFSTKFMYNCKSKIGFVSFKK